MEVLQQPRSGGLSEQQQHQQQEKQVVQSSSQDKQESYIPDVIEEKRKDSEGRVLR